MKIYNTIMCAKHLNLPNSLFVDRVIWDHIALDLVLPTFRYEYNSIVRELEHKIS